jgi:hypothetical protein
MHGTQHILYFSPGFFAVLSPSTQQGIYQLAVAGVSSNIVVECNLGHQDETPFWYINGSVYELLYSGTFSIKYHTCSHPSGEWL